MISRTTNTTGCHEHGNFIRLRRKESRRTQVESANHADVTQSYYQAIESGEKPIYVHKLREHADHVKLGTVDLLLSQLTEVRYRLVRVAEDHVSAESYSTLIALVNKTSQVCQAMAAALEDGVVSDEELDVLEEKAEQAEEMLGKLRRGIAVNRALRKRARKESSPGLQRVVTGEIAQARAAKVG